MRNIFKKTIPLLLLAIMLAACGPTATTPTKPVNLAETRKAPPTPVRQATKPGGMSLGTVSLSSSGKSPDYTIKTDMPVLQGIYPHRDEFNQRVSALVTQETEAFKKNLADWTPVPGMTESSFNLLYTAYPYKPRFVSILFTDDYYMAGAAHPSHQMFSLVYDLEIGQDVTLDQLFLSNSNYLQVIADICKAELGRREIGFDDQQHGADPVRENYTVWNLSTDGLIITFNEYQVAAYAAGPQTVVIPFDALKTIINPQGPLG